MGEGVRKSLFVAAAAALVLSPLVDAGQVARALETVSASQATSYARPLPKPVVDKNAIWIVFIGGAAGLFGITLALENNPAFFPSIAKANRASTDALKMTEERERRATMEETTLREVERQTSMVEEGLKEARAKKQLAAQQAAAVQPPSQAPPQPSQAPPQPSTSSSSPTPEPEAAKAEPATKAREEAKAEAGAAAEASVAAAAVAASTHTEPAAAEPVVDSSILEIEAELAKRQRLESFPRPRRAVCVCAASSGAGAGDAANEPPPGSLEARLGGVAQTVTNMFPVWVVLAGGLALSRPETFLWFKLTYITYGLGFTMLGMGLTMRVADFTTVFTKMPGLLALGMVLQFTVMPLIGFAISRYAGLEAPLAIGMCILSSCPGGTASNIVAFIGKGEMGLSILMTTASTLAAIVMTPLLTTWLAGTLVPVDPRALFMSTLQVVLAPVVLGAFLNQSFPATVSRVARFSPAVATLLISLIVGSTLAHNAEAALRCGGQLFAAVAALHGAGFVIGYGVSKALGLSNKIARTNSIEVGMQNATLGAVLAALHFNDPLVAAPCAVSSCTQSVMGSLIAAYWRATTPEDEGDTGTSVPMGAA